MHANFEDPELLLENVIKCSFAKVITISPSDSMQINKKYQNVKLMQRQEFLDLEAHIFKLFCSDAETFKNAVFPCDFGNGYTPYFIPEGNKMDVFPVDIYIRNWSIPYVNINGEKGHLVTFVYEMGGVPIFKIMGKECIFERFSKTI